MKGRQIPLLLHIDSSQGTDCCREGCCEKRHIAEGICQDAVEPFWFIKDISYYD